MDITQQLLDQLDELYDEVQTKIERRRVTKIVELEIELEKRSNR